MKNIIKWLEEKIGKRDTNRFLFGISVLGLVSSVFWLHYSSFWLLPYVLFVYLLGWSFEKVNAPPKKKGKENDN